MMFKQIMLNLICLLGSGSFFPLLYGVYQAENKFFIPIGGLL